MSPSPRVLKIRVVGLWVEPRLHAKADGEIQLFADAPIVCARHLSKMVRGRACAEDEILVFGGQNLLNHVVVLAFPFKHERF